MTASRLLALVIVAVTSLSSSLAGAQPREERGGPVPYGTRVRRPPPPPPPVYKDGDWVSLSTPTPTRHGTEFFMVDPNAGAFRMLRIQAISGTVQLRQIRIQLASGRLLTYNVNIRLDRWRPMTVVNFGRPHQITQISVTTARRPYGVYTLSGSWRRPFGELVSVR